MPDIEWQLRYGSEEQPEVAEFLGYKENAVTKLVSIGPNLFARTKMSVIEQYWAKQTKCPHTKRDPRGKCYACGQERREA